MAFWSPMEFCMRWYSRPLRCDKIIIGLKVKKPVSLIGYVVGFKNNVAFSLSTIRAS
jgi:hypothetical protein